MFHTFQSANAPRSPESTADGSKGKTVSRRISTSNACVECRRRKIRCDGAQPCGQCQWYQHPEQCAYSKPTQRVVPSRKLVDKLHAQIEQHKAILQELYPRIDHETLIGKSRAELLDLALLGPAPGTASDSLDSISGAESTASPISEGEQSLEALEQPPEENPMWDEAKKHELKIQGISDDVNGLSMSLDRHPSYVGISSIAAALKVIIKVAPIAQQYIAQTIIETTLPSRAHSPPGVGQNHNALPRPQDAHRLIEIYFEKVHVFFPMIDERKFWNTYLHGERKDSPWLALFNMVLAVGSLAFSTSANEGHYIYFTRARRHLSFESFGSGNVEVLQAISIMGGYYMHYLNRPNEAHSLMGGALRMATTLGLHREYSEPISSPPDTRSPGRPSFSDAVTAEMRRRVWWSLFCLDSWASTTTGRPSLGRLGNSITVNLPGRHIELSQPASSSDLDALKILPLTHCSAFCKIATRIQDRLIEVPLLKFEELSEFDSEIGRWHTDLPNSLRNLDEPCPEFLKIIRLIMKWRYQNLRIVLHRPTLLACALRRTPFNALTAEEKVLVGKCRTVAAETIEDISAECPDDLIAGWNGVWFVYQACMIPLISLFTDYSSLDEIERWKTQVETGIAYFDRIEKYSIAANKSQAAIAKLYEAWIIIQRRRVVNSLDQNQTLASGQPELGSSTTDTVHSGSTLNDLFLLPNGDPDMNMSIWPGTNDMSSLSGFWDDMMWDTNFPDMSNNEYILPDFDYNHSTFLPDQSGWPYGPPE